LSWFQLSKKIANYLVEEGEYKKALSEYSRALGIALVHRPGDDELVVELLKNISKISPLAFLSYKNYSQKKGDGKTVLISLNSLEDVRGIIEGVLDLNICLSELRGMILKECSYFKFFKFEFFVGAGDKGVDMVDEKIVKVQECVVLKDGFLHVVIKQDSLGLKGRWTC